MGLLEIDRIKDLVRTSIANLSIATALASPNQAIKLYSKKIQLPLTISKILNLTTAAISKFSF